MVSYELEEGPSVQTILALRELRLILKRISLYIRESLRLMQKYNKETMNSTLAKKDKLK